MTKSCTCCAVAVLKVHVQLMSPVERGLGVNDAFFPVTCQTMITFVVDLAFVQVQQGTRGECDSATSV